MGIGDPAVRKPNSSVQSVLTYVWLYYSKIESSDSKKVRHLKFIYSKKAQIFCKISTADLTVAT